MHAVRPIRSLAFVTVTAAAALASAGSARATERVIVALDVEFAPSLGGCPDGPQFEAMIAGPLGYAPFRPDAPRLVAVRISPGERGLEGSIEWRDDLGRAPAERRFATAARDCVAMARTLAFALTVELQMLASEEEEAAAQTARARAAPASTPEKAAASPEPAPPSTATAPPPPPVVAATAPEPGRVTIAVGTGMSAALGLTPRAALGARGFVAARRRHLALELELAGTLPSTTAMAAGPDFSHHVVATAAAACYEPGWFSACVLAQAARLTIRGVGVDAPTTSSGWALAAGLRAAAARRLGDRLFVRGRVEALAALTDWTVTLNHEAVWTRPRVAATAGVDIGLRFQ